MPDRPQIYIYLTSEQIQRLAALTLDALVGAQIESTTSIDSSVTGSFVRLDDPSSQTFFTINPDGSWTDDT